MRLTFEHRYRVIETKDDADRGRWKATTVAYLYDIDDEVGELLAYHWHPVGHHADPRPHLHIRTDEGGRIWLPAGRVAVEEIIRLLVEQFEVAPQRNDWEQILDEAQTAFETWRTWGMTPPPTAQSR